MVPTAVSNFLTTSIPTVRLSGFPAGNISVPICQRLKMRPLDYLRFALSVSRGSVITLADRPLPLCSTSISIQGHSAPYRNLDSYSGDIQRYAQVCLAFSRRGFHFWCDIRDRCWVECITENEYICMRIGRDALVRSRYLPEIPIAPTRERRSAG
jgi:hypothetical protein